MRKIIISDSDRCKLEALLSSERAAGTDSIARSEELRSELRRAKIIPSDDVPAGVVTVNSTVVLRDLDTDERETYTLVLPQNADIAESRLSVLAPVGTAILGEHVGDDVHWRVPGGWRRLQIEKVINPSERDSAILCN